MYYSGKTVRIDELVERSHRHYEVGAGHEASVKRPNTTVGQRTGSG